MPVYLIDKAKRTVVGQKIADMVDMAGAYIKSIVMHEGAIRVTSQSAAVAEVVTDLVPGKVAPNSIHDRHAAGRCGHGSQARQRGQEASLTRIDTAIHPAEQGQPAPYPSAATHCTCLYLPRH